MIQRCKTYFHIGHTLREMHFYGELGCTKKFTTENSRKLFGIEVEAWALLQHFTSRLFLEAVIIKFFFSVFIVFYVHNAWPHFTSHSRSAKER